MQAPVGTFLHKSTYKFTFLSYIIRRVLNYFFWCCNYNKYGIATLDHGINFVPHSIIIYQNFQKVASSMILLGQELASFPPPLERLGTRLGKNVPLIGGSKVCDIPIVLRDELSS